MDLYQDGQVRVLELDSPLPLFSRESQIFFFLLTQKANGSLRAQIVLLPCLLGTLVVTRRALTHSIAESNLLCYTAGRKKQLHLFSHYLSCLLTPLGG